MEIKYDPEKRERTLAERGLDFEDAVHVFAGRTIDLSMIDRTMERNAGSRSDGSKAALSRWSGLPAAKLGTSSR